MENLIKPPVYLGVFFILISLLSSCAWLERIATDKSDENYRSKLVEQDYIEQLNHQGQVYLGERQSMLVNLRKSSQEYFGKLIQKLKSANEKYFIDVKQVYKLEVIRDQTPYYFSLPNGVIVLSTGLLKKYIDNESLFAVILSRMLFVSAKRVYVKKISIPRGTLSTIEMMKLVDLPLHVRSEVNKWVYHILNRAGFDGLAVLNWIQIQNKSILDFSMMYKDLSLISREEFEFKNFIVSTSERLLAEEDRNSSQDFYMFKKDVIKSATVIPIRRATN